MVAIIIFATTFHLFMRRYARQITAIFLLFLFLEKAGVRLWIHTHYHICASTEASSKNYKFPHPSFSGQCCDCMDDFFIPLTHTDEVTLSIPAIQYCDLFFIHYKSLISSSLCLSSQHRGPPSIL